MNCQEFHEGYVVLLDSERAGPEQSRRAELAEHLKTCRSCAQFYDEITRTMALLRPSTQVNASPQFKGNVMDKINRIVNEEAGISSAETRQPRRKKTWQFALAAGIAGLLVCGALVWLKFHSVGNGGVELPAFSLFREACAAEESLFKGEGIVSIVNEIVVKPVSDPTLAKLRWLPIMSLDASGKTHINQLTLPANAGEKYGVGDYVWYDPPSQRFVHVMMVEGKPIFANSYDGTAVYLLEPDASGAMRVVRTPVTRDFHAPKKPAEILGIAAGMANSFDERSLSFVSDAGPVELRDGSAGRAVKLGFPGGGPQELSNTYWLCKIRESSNTIDEMEWIAGRQSMLVLRHAETRNVETPGIPWNLAGLKSEVGWPNAGPKPAIAPDMVRPDVSVQHMVEKADFETYIFASDPPWASKRELMDVLDVASPPQRMFILCCLAGDHRHVVLVQSPSYNKMIGQVAKTGSLAYTSANGCKVWSGPRGKWLAGILLQSAQSVTKDKPAENRTGYILETPAGTFPALAINGPVTDAELHALIDSLIPAKEYLKRFPAPAASSAFPSNSTGIEAQASGKQEASEISLRQMVEKAGYETYLFAVDPPWTFERHIAITVDGTTSPPQSQFLISYRARDGRHIVLIEVPSSNREVPMAEQAMKMSVSAYTSPSGVKVCSNPNNMLARKILQRAQPWIKDPPAANSTAYLIKTPAGTFATLAVNDKLTDEELHALIGSLIPAKEYLKRFPASDAAGAEKTGTTSP